MMPNDGYPGACASGLFYAWKYSKRIIYIPRLSVLNAVNGNEHAEKKGNLSIRRSMIDTGVHKKALIRGISGYLPGRLA